MAIAEKKLLSVEDIESQMGLELPNRDTLATAVVSCLAVCTGNISIKNISVQAANNICAQVAAANSVGVAIGALLGLAGVGTGAAVPMDCRVHGGGTSQQ